MALCSKCLFYRKEYDEYWQGLDDVVKKGDTKLKHHCPMYDSQIPDGMFNGDKDCKYYSNRDEYTNQNN